MTEQIPFPEPLGEPLPELPKKETVAPKIQPERKKGGKRRPPLKIGDEVYSPNTPPDRKLPKGTEWLCIERHHDKSYALWWKVIASPSPRIIPKRREWVAGIEKSQPKGDRE